MNHTHIRIKGAKTHNLKNIDVSFPLNSITCIAGPSGSGKSSLAFHTILTESKRRFMNSFPSDVKFFWDIPQSADVDEITPVLPVWGLAQHNPVVGSRPAAIDLMSVGDLFSKLLFNMGRNYCSTHLVPLEVNLSIVGILAFLEEQNLSDKDVVHFFLDSEDYLKIHGDGFYPSRSFGEGVNEFDEGDEYWELFRLRASKLQSMEKKLADVGLVNASGLVLIYIPNKNLKKLFRISKNRQCPKCGEVEKINISSPSVFSPFTPLGACIDCSGHGRNLKYDRVKIVKDERLSLKEGAVNFLTYSRFSHLEPLMLKEAKKAGFDITIPFHKLSRKVWKFLEEGAGQFCGLFELYEYLESKRYKKNVRILIRSLKTEVLCESCEGTRLKKDVLSFRVPEEKKYSLRDILLFNFEELFAFIGRIKEQRERIENWEEVKKIVGSLERILKVAIDLGLGRVLLQEKVKSLSINNYQKILLVKYLSFVGSGSLFILDEASLGLDANEVKVLWKYLQILKKEGNTIILVDHNDYLQKNSDEVIIMGPGAGHNGGEITYQGKFQKTKKLKVESRKKRELKKTNISGISIGQFVQKEIEFKVQGVNLVRGKSTSGKKDLYIEALGNIVSEVLGLDKISNVDVEYRRPKNLFKYEKVLVLNSKFNKFSSRSTVGTMVGLTPYIRKHFANLAVSKNLNLKEGHFSSNSDLGKCSTCEGRGLQSIDMQFLEDVQFVCDDCKGMKLKPFLATISDGFHTIYETLSKPMNEILPNLKLTPKGKRIWEYLKLLNLDYLSLDRSLSSLSGGEKQRLKLLSELQKSIENSLIILEDLSFGLSRHEIYRIGEFVQDLTNNGNTIVLIDENEHFSGFVDEIIQV
ncbi:hypothetical protein [Halobacteriovorax sp. JY17]|uniref:hypothetical protein n=1 Tax=Halobacteriovorax sp. JY17 TaxID=2014617 RepID=UPI000C57A0A8|nr:hypothetical protein [Halobacteriovorax sp. JY17]PIK14492.1 MAG: hypothetical protein CES88_09105 [Halobacteriovorax sp. JY17]